MRTLKRVSQRPPPTDIRWMEISAMLRAVGVEIVERSGARVLLRRGSERMVIHRPHPNPEVSATTIRDIAKFLKQIGLEQ